MKFMFNLIKKIINFIVPSGLMKLFISVFGDYSFWGNYISWKAATKASSGYDNPELLEKVVASAKRVRDGHAVYARDGVNFQEVEYSWPMVAGLMCLAAAQGELNVLDFGGAFGSSYLQFKSLALSMEKFSWNIIEQEKMVQVGRKEFTQDSLDFYSSIDECLNEKKCNVVVAASVLQYMPDPMSTIDSLASVGAEMIIVDRTPFWLSQHEKQLSVQKVKSSIYKASYPCWFFNYEELLQRFKSHGYDVFNEYKDSIADDVYVNVFTRAEFRGIIFTKANK